MPQDGSWVQIRLDLTPAGHTVMVIEIGVEDYYKRKAYNKNLSVLLQSEGQGPL